MSISVIPKSPVSTRTFVGLAFFALCVSAYAQPVPRGAPGAGPIGYTAHGGIFDSAGNEIAPSLAFIETAQAWYRDRLLARISKQDRTRFEAMERRIELDSSTVAAVDAANQAATSGQRAQRLAQVTVVDAASLGPRYANFERRRKTGAGQYLVRDDIEKAGSSNLQDAVRAMRGVQLDCGGGNGCTIHMTRAPMRCTPEYVVDDNVDNTFGPDIPVRDIEALEVYTGPSDVPGEYAGRNAGCGVIVIWTRSGPSRQIGRAHV